MVKFFNILLFAVCVFKPVRAYTPIDDPMLHKEIRFPVSETCKGDGCEYIPKVVICKVVGIYNTHRSLWRCHIDDLPIGKYLKKYNIICNSNNTSVTFKNVYRVCHIEYRVKSDIFLTILGFIVYIMKILSIIFVTSVLAHKCVMSRHSSIPIGIPVYGNDAPTDVIIDLPKSSNKLDL